MAGGLLISTGAIATSFTTSVNQIYVTYGLVAGIGLLSFFEPHYSLVALSLEISPNWSCIFCILQVLATVWPSCPLWPSSLSTSPVDGPWSQLWLPLESPCSCPPWHQVRVLLQLPCFQRVYAKTHVRLKSFQTLQTRWLSDHFVRNASCLQLTLVVMSVILIRSFRGPEALWLVIC